MSTTSQINPATIAATVTNKAFKLKCKYDNLRAALSDIAFFKDMDIMSCYLSDGSVVWITARNDKIVNITHIPRFLLVPDDELVQIALCQPIEPIEADLIAVISDRDTFGKDELAFTFMVDEIVEAIYDELNADANIYVTPHLRSMCPIKGDL